MILEVATLNVRVGLEREFEAAFAQGSLLIASMPGYISHQLQRCVETSNRYALLVKLDIYRSAHHWVPWLTRISTLEAAASSLL